MTRFYLFIFVNLFMVLLYFLCVYTRITSILKTYFLLCLLQLRHLNELLGLYTSFSRNNYKSPLQMASTILNTSAFANLNAVLSHTKDYFPNTGRLVYKMVKSAILELNNEIKFQKYHPESKLMEIKELLFSAFQYLYKAWQVQDEIKKKKMAEEAALFKTVHHEDEMSDEDKLDKELKELFPFYDEVHK